MFTLRNRITGLGGHSLAAALTLAVIIAVPAAAGPKPPIQVTWENLSMVNGRTVRIALADGTVTGKALRVEPDALIVQVKRGSGGNAYSDGILRAPREKLGTIEMQTRGKLFRVVGTFLGVHLIGGLAAIGSLAIVWERETDARDAAALALLAGGVIGGGWLGYTLGNKLDRGWTVVRILP